MDIGNILSRAWQIVWKHKVLWIFGILTSCGTATGSGSSNVGTNMSMEGEQFFFQPRFVFPPVENLPDWLAGLVIGLIVLIIIALMILAIALGTIGRIGVIRGTLIADRGDPRFSFGELLNEGWPYFWRVLGLNLLLGLAILIFVFLVFAFFFATSVVTLGLAVLCLLPLLCLFIPAVWLLQIFIEQANVALVVEDLEIVPALRRAWEVIKNNIGSILVMGLILIIGVGLIGNFILGLPFGLVAIPIMGGAQLGNAGGLRVGALLSMLCLVAYLPILLILSGILRAFTLSGWTLTFLRLTGEPSAKAEEIETA